MSIISFRAMYCKFPVLSGKVWAFGLTWEASAWPFSHCGKGPSSPLLNDPI